MALGELDATVLDAGFQCGHAVEIPRFVPVRLRGASSPARKESPADLEATPGRTGQLRQQAPSQTGAP
jgi:hypothetical protein